MDDKEVKSIIDEYMKQVKEQNIVLKAKGNFSINSIIRPDRDMLTIQLLMAHDSIEKVMEIKFKNNCYYVAGILSTSINKKTCSSLKESIYCALDNMLR
ncbi:hypothetical protein [uncultured Clostridium sp.]|uniref:hypothetical protein n=1 Tax=uncultured Clostridium sp. TaxID=59620 RepID=UPI0028EC8FD4|nr:hypothetical protein [uncultured Clostridium sp.]